MTDKRINTLSMLTIRLKLIFKKIQLRPNPPEADRSCLIARLHVKKTMLTKKPLQLSERLLFVLMGASICCAEDEAVTQFTVFDLSALKKQYLILYPY
jgi:hypothetical protein